jgi:hypothetical protein
MPSSGAEPGSAAGASVHGQPVRLWLRLLWLRRDHMGGQNEIGKITPVTVRVPLRRHRDRHCISSANLRDETGEEVGIRHGNHVLEQPARLGIAREAFADQYPRRIAGDNTQERKCRGDIFFFHGAALRSPYRLRQTVHFRRSIGQRFTRSTRGYLLLVNKLVDGDLVILTPERDCLLSID